MTLSTKGLWNVPATRARPSDRRKRVDDAAFGNGAGFISYQLFEARLSVKVATRQAQHPAIPSEQRQRDLLGISCRRNLPDRQSRGRPIQYAIAIEADGRRFDPLDGRQPRRRARPVWFSIVRARLGRSYQIFHNGHFTKPDWLMPNALGGD